MVAWIDFDVEDSVFLITSASSGAELADNMEEEHELEVLVVKVEDDDHDSESDEEEDETEGGFFLVLRLGSRFLVDFGRARAALLLSRPLCSIILAPSTSPARALVTARSTSSTGSVLLISLWFNRSRMLFSIIFFLPSVLPRLLSSLLTFAIFAS